MSDRQSEANQAQEQANGEPYSGVIGTGDQFEWNYYGHSDWPHSWAILEVVDVVDNGEELFIAAVPTTSTDAQVDSGPYWISEDRFREAVRLRRRGEKVNEFEPHKYTTERPRKTE